MSNLKHSAKKNECNSDDCVFCLPENVTMGETVLLLRSSLSVKPCNINKEEQYTKSL